MSSSIRSPMFCLDDGGSVVKAILSILFMAILISMIHRFHYPATSDLTKAEVNVGFGDSGDSITASATIRVEAPVSDDVDVDWSIPDVNLPTSSIPDINLPTYGIPDVKHPTFKILPLSLPKCCKNWNPDCSWLEHMIEGRGHLQLQGGGLEHDG